MLPTKRTLDTLEVILLEGLRFSFLIFDCVLSFSSKCNIAVFVLMAFLLSPCHALFFPSPLSHLHWQTASFISLKHGYIYKAFTLKFIAGLLFNFNKIGISYLRFLSINIVNFIFTETVVCTSPHSICWSVLRGFFIFS